MVETVNAAAGRMILVVHGAEHPLAAGATATFEADATHVCRGAGTGPCDLITTVHLSAAPELRG
ncbi:hypothetical protein [Streptomyces sp. NPDC090022]|uniref:hypothetical protein n=1 Tax=Streptomyces sp. NPDC090022 TaxID=3365920 RepID=UPI0037FA9F41